MRRILQLRTPENGPTDDHQRLGLNGEAPPAVAQPKIRFREPQIEMAHGAGGKASRRLIEGLFVPLLCGASTAPLADAAHVNLNGARVAITTDSFVVKPLRFPGGSIGELAINGTVNDLAVSGAKAEVLVVTFILEAGLPSEILQAEVQAMADAAREAGVRIAGGDTKVVEHGKADSMYISTTGIGVPIPGIEINPAAVRPGDKVLLSGPVGDHGITILLARGELDLEADLFSDTRSVLPLVEAIVRAAGPSIRWMRDPTRGGAATTLNELARDCGLGVVLREDAIPVHDAVRGACELLGLDPLHIANEGQFLAVVAPDSAEAALLALRQTPGGEEAQIIGEIQEQPAGAVLVTTLYGGTRIVDMLVGDPLPRIC
ncbi:MAG: hydrogenase expression/formation protein HypE [Candidatus Acidiferrales bacterium]